MKLIKTQLKQVTVKYVKMQEEPCYQQGKKRLIFKFNQYF